MSTHHSVSTETEAPLPAKSEPEGQNLPPEPDKEPGTTSGTENYGSVNKQGSDKPRPDEPSHPTL